MKDDEIFQKVVKEHKGAMGTFKDTYSFKVKQNDILYYIESALRKYQSEQLSDLNKIAALTKTMAKRQVKIDSLSNQLEITESVTELDIFGKGED